QDSRVRASGPGLRYGRGERAPRLQTRPARLWDRGANPDGSRRQIHAATDEQPAEICRPAGVRTLDLRGSSAGDSRIGIDAQVPEDQKGQAGPQALLGITACPARTTCHKISVCVRWV